MWFGFLRALRNVGFAVGGVLAGVALTIGTDAAYQAVVVANAASYVAGLRAAARRCRRRRAAASTPSPDARGRVGRVRATAATGC